MLEANNCQRISLDRSLASLLIYLPGPFNVPSFSHYLVPPLATPGGTYHPLFRHSAEADPAIHSGEELYFLEWGNLSEKQDLSFNWEIIHVRGK